MALGTLGTSATTSLTSLNPWNYGSSGQDVGSLANLIKDDQNPTHPIAPGAFEQNGLLFIPRRGLLKVLPGDYVGVDANGWPILVSAYSIATGGWTHS